MAISPIKGMKAVQISPTLFALKLGRILDMLTRKRFMN